MHTTRSVSGFFSKIAVFGAFSGFIEDDPRKAWTDASASILEPIRAIISGHGRDDSPATVPGEGRERLSIREASGLPFWQL